MSSDRVSIEIPISIENDLEVDNDGHFFVLTFIFPAQKLEGFDFAALKTPPEYEVPPSFFQKCRNNKVVPVLVK